MRELWTAVKMFSVCFRWIDLSHSNKQAFAERLSGHKFNLVLDGAGPFLELELVAEFLGN